jgi:predicted phosphate transport protein (TIGR00153 family)
MRRGNSIIRWFMPKEERFHTLFERDTDNLVKAVHLFSEIAHSTNLEDRRVKKVQLKALEHSGDEVTQDIFEALNSTFITPMDREDIREIAMGMDDILDYLEGGAQYLIMFALADAPEPLRRFADILTAMVDEVAKLTGWIWDLSNEKEIHQGIQRISELENEADALYNTVIADLYNSAGRSPVEIMKWKEIYQACEEACDACRDYTHGIANIVVKNA